MSISFRSFARLAPARTVTSPALRFKGRWARRPGFLCTRIRVKFFSPALRCENLPPVPALASITIHQSQWPVSLAAQLCDSLRRRQINPKFHYESPRQVRQWLRLHEAYSPARQTTDFRDTYTPAFAAAMQCLGAAAVQLIGLGCGGGQKESSLLRHLVEGKRPVKFTAADVSAGMVITSLQAAWAHLPPEDASGLVCDLAEVEDPASLFEAPPLPGARRVVTFFGLIPNFEPEATRTVWQRLLRPSENALVATIACTIQYSTLLYHTGM